MSDPATGASRGQRRDFLRRLGSHRRRRLPPRTNGYLFILDRRKDMIITGGFNVYPSEIENVVSSIPGVHEVVVNGAPATAGEEVTAFVVLADGTGSDVNGSTASPAPRRLQGAEIGRRRRRTTQDRNRERSRSRSCADLWSAPGTAGSDNRRKHLGRGTPCPTTGQVRMR
ncbi:long-chain fatty acid--CoA ligase [Pseudonocardia sp. MCCB 268]|nr:long-chain fatty acid--CoA ligase [Pseudonocardia cytotoxica]